MSSLHILLLVLGHFSIIRPVSSDFYADAAAALVGPDFYCKVFTVSNGSVAVDKPALEKARSAIEHDIKSTFNETNGSDREKALKAGDQLCEKINRAREDGKKQMDGKGVSELEEVVAKMTKNLEEAKTQMANCMGKIMSAGSSVKNQGAEKTDHKTANKSEKPKNPVQPRHKSHHASTPPKTPTHHHRSSNKHVVKESHRSSRRSRKSSLKSSPKLPKKRSHRKSKDVKGYYKSKHTHRRSKMKSKSKTKSKQSKKLSKAKSKSGRKNKSKTKSSRRKSRKA